MKQFVDGGAMVDDVNERWLMRMRMRMNTAYSDGREEGREGDCQQQQAKATATGYGGESPQDFELGEESLARKMCPTVPRPFAVEAGWGSTLLPPSHHPRRPPPHPVRN